MNLKKIIYFLLSICLLVFLAVFLFELVLQTIPLFSRIIPENNKIKYVYVLGESSAYGVPYNGKISFAKIIRYISSNNIDNKNIKLINLSVPGHKLIHQYFRYFIYRYTHPLHKGILLIYAGTNEPSFDMINNLSFFDKLNLGKIMSIYSNKIDDFHYMYENIIRLAKSFGDDIYVSTIAGNYAGFMPDNVDYLEQSQTVMNNLINIDNLFFQGQYKQALSVCLNNINQENKSHIFYRIGKIYEKHGEIKEANDFYIKATNIPNSDKMRQRPTKNQNEIIRFLADKYEVPCLDIFNKLYNSNEIIGFNFFIDKIHPTIRLNIMIAEGFVDLLSEKYSIKKINDGITEEKIKKIFNFTNEDLFQTYVQALGEVFVYTYKNEILNKYALSEIKEYIIIIKNLNITDDVKKEEQKKTIEFLEKMLEYITSSEPRDILRKKIKEIYYYSLDEQYKYAFDSNFNEMLKENKII